MLDRWREEAGKNGRAASGWERRSRPPPTDASSCSSSRKASTRRRISARSAAGRRLHDGSCPLDGTTMERGTAALDLALHQTLAHGGTVQVIRDRDDLGPVGGVAALLRF